MSRTRQESFTACQPHFTKKNGLLSEQNGKVLFGDRRFVNPKVTTQAHDREAELLARSLQVDKAFEFEVRCKMSTLKPAPESSLWTTLFSGYLALFSCFSWSFLRCISIRFDVS